MGKWVDADDVNEKELMRKMKNLFDEALAKEQNDWEDPITFAQFVEAFDENDKLTKRFFEVLLKEGRRRRLRNRAERQHQRMSADASARLAANVDARTLNNAQRVRRINHWYPNHRLIRARMRRDGVLTGRDLLGSLTHDDDDLWPGAAAALSTGLHADGANGTSATSRASGTQANGASAAAGAGASATSATPTRARSRANTALHPNVPVPEEPRAERDTATSRAGAQVDVDDDEDAITDGLQMLAATLLQRVTGAVAFEARMG
eukprot:m.531267 g.531267  ORF g.531267 m.531267 type:complete len:264 (-) comp22030_c0_seq3:1765-2556(-)